MIFGRAIAMALFAASVVRAGQVVAPPPPGKLYQGLYFDDPAAGHDPTEHDVTEKDVTQFEQAVGTKTAWVFFSNNWFGSRKFPRTTCDWIFASASVASVVT